MVTNKPRSHVPFIIAALLLIVCRFARAEDVPYLQVSGIYPHLATFNTPLGKPAQESHGECGIGAVVPWAGKLWYISYPPHMRRGSLDKLYEVDENLHVTIRPESVGGTHGSRLIHRESKQLIIGPYFIDEHGKVRVPPLTKLEGRMTGTARHLTDPANKVYFYDMEGAVYEVDVHSLAVTKLFEHPVPGWHGKGGYTAQGRLVVTNNGELEPGGGHSYQSLLVGGPAKNEDDAGVLAEWDGREWRIVERKQFTEATGPGGILGSPDDASPLWSTGWDRRSVILKLLDGGKWTTYRLPRGSHAFDGRHGWFTEWPRIREIAPDRLMMVMHGTMFDFPKTFSAVNTAGIRPLATHLRYIPDFCHWNGRLILAGDDTSIMSNPLAGQPQSNLWFGTVADLGKFGPRSGWGGPWLGDAVKASEPSDPFLVAGYDERILHLAHNAKEPVQLTVEIDRAGNGKWSTWKTLTVANGYQFFVLPADLQAEWLRLKTDRDCQATAYMHLASQRRPDKDEQKLFAGLADVGQATGFTAGLIRPAGHNRGLQVLASSVSPEGRVGNARYLEVGLSDDSRAITIARPAEDRSDEMSRLAEVPKPFDVDAASVIVTDGAGRRFRLPKGDAAFDKAMPSGWPRGIREAVSERFLANLHGSFYEIPRDAHNRPDIQRLRPVCSHHKAITDFCTWRGLLVLAGVRQKAALDSQVFSSGDGTALWFGAIDDLWKLGKPVGVGGPWKDTAVKADLSSDPYLMTGYDRQRVELSHDQPGDVTFTIEINFDHRLWRPYQTLRIPAGSVLKHAFPEGFHAHWVRLTANRDCRATATLIYE